MQLVGEGDCHGHSGLPVIRLHHHRCGVLREAVRKIKNHSIKCPDPAEQSFLLVKHPNPALPTVYLRAIGDIVLEDSTVGAVSEDNVVGHHRDCSTSHSTLICDVFGTCVGFSERCPPASTTCFRLLLLGRAIDSHCSHLLHRWRLLLLLLGGRRGRGNSPPPPSPDVLLLRRRGGLRLAGTSSLRRCATTRASPCSAFSSSRHSFCELCKWVNEGRF